MVRVYQDTEAEAPIEQVGGKAKGLLALKSLEDRIKEEVCILGKVVVPRFLVVPPTLNLAANYSQIVQAVRSLGANSYAVRSSSPLEDGGEDSFDGIFDTILDVPENKVMRAIQSVKKSGNSDKARRYAHEVGATLTGDIPVVVQAMVSKIDYQGVVYSQFPSPHKVVKIIRQRPGSNDSLIDVFRRYRKKGREFIDCNPIVLSGDERQEIERAEDLGRIALFLEERIGYPIIMEFAISGHISEQVRSLLQARKLTKLKEAQEFRVPELDEKDLIVSVPDVNGTGDFTGSVVLAKYSGDKEGITNLSQIEMLDNSHPEGYILVTPYIEFWRDNIDEITSNKKAVIAYTDLGRHHDREISRKRGLLYVNTRNSNLDQLFFQAENKSSEWPIKTGDKLRVVSDGIRGLVFRLSN